MRNCTLIAEIGCNHMGNMDIAREIINVAKDFCHVDHIKFQKRRNRELLKLEQYDAPHPVPENSYGPTYGAHREYLEFTIEQHRELKQYCYEHGVIYASSVWDITSLREIASLEPTYIKIPSATNTHFELLEIACKEFSGNIHVSLGMTTRTEEKALLELFRDNDRIGDLCARHVFRDGPGIVFGKLCGNRIMRGRRRKLKIIGVVIDGDHDVVGGIETILDDPRRCRDFNRCLGQ